VDGQAKLSGIPETMLLTLYHRALETQRPDRLFEDKYAITFVDRIDHEFSKFDDWRMRWAIPVRTWLIDSAVRTFLDRHPGAMIVTLGSGLCARALRFNNGQARWFSIDLESVRPFWHALIGESARNSFVACSVTDMSWCRIIEGEARGRAVLFITEGLFQYLEEADVKQVVGTIRQRFPGSEMVVEVLGEFTVKNTRLNPTVAATGSVFRWGLNDCKEMESWGDGIKLLDQWFLVDYQKERQGYMSRLPDILGGKGQFGKVAHLRFG